MKLNLDDPRLTAYALGEVEDKERQAIAHALQSDPEAQRFVEEIQEIAASLKVGFAEESIPDLTADQRSAIRKGVPSKERKTSFHPASRWLISGSLAASFVLFVGINIRNSLQDSAVSSESSPPSSLSFAPASDGVRAEQESIRPLTRSLEESAPSAPQAKTALAEQPELALDALGRDILGRATEAQTALMAEMLVLDDDTVFTPITETDDGHISLTITDEAIVSQDLRAQFEANQWPPSDPTLIDQLLRELSPPESADRQSVAKIDIELNEAPWASENRLLYVRPTLNETSESALVVEFNHLKVQAYRYLNNLSSDTEAHYLTRAQPTALFELIPTPEAADHSNAPWARVRLEGQTSIQETAIESDVPLTAATPAFQYTSAIARFGLLLQDPPQSPTQEFQELLDGSRNFSIDTEKHQEFLDLVRMAETAVNERQPED